MSDAMTADETYLYESYFAEYWAGQKIYAPQKWTIAHAAWMAAVRLALSFRTAAAAAARAAERSRCDTYRRRARALLRRMRLCREAHRSNVNILIDAQVRALAAEAELAKLRAYLSGFEPFKTWAEDDAALPAAAPAAGGDGAK